MSEENQDIIHAVRIQRDELKAAIESGTVDEFLNELLAMTNSNLIEFIHMEIEEGNLP